LNVGIAWLQLDRPSRAIDRSGLPARSSGRNPLQGNCEQALVRVDGGLYQAAL